MSTDSPTDLTPATGPDPDLLHELRLTVGLAELHAAIHQHRAAEEAQLVEAL